MSLTVILIGTVVVGGVIAAVAFSKKAKSTVADAEQQVYTGFKEAEVKTEGLVTKVEGTIVADTVIAKNFIKAEESKVKDEAVVVEDAVSADVAKVKAAI
jgi:hypothetical protein